jgi:hypothetical protein
METWTGKLLSKLKLKNYEKKHPFQHRRITFY